MSMMAKSGAELVPGGCALREDHWYALEGGGQALVTSESRGQGVAFGVVWALRTEGAVTGGGWRIVEREWQWRLLDGKSVRRLPGAGELKRIAGIEAAHPYDVLGELREYRVTWDDWAPWVAPWPDAGSDAGYPGS